MRLEPKAGGGGKLGDPSQVMGSGDDRLLKMYSKPDRVIACPVALRNNSGSPVFCRTASHILRILAVSFP